MSRLCQCLQNFWALHAQDEAAALIQSSGGAAERENVPYVLVRRWQQLVKAALALGDAEWQVVGINVAPFSIEETALMLLVAEETRWVYVPVDVQLPLARQIEMVQNAGVHRLVTTVDSPLATFFASRDAARVTAAMEWRTVESTTSPFQFVQVLALSDCYFGSEREESLLGCKRRELAAENDGHEIAAPLYVLFTSGTTGKPRGVLGTRTGAWTRLKWMWTTYPFAENGERVLRATKLSFVDSVWEILGAFLRRVPLVHIQQPRRHHDDTFARQDVMKNVVLDDSALFLEVLRIEEVTRFTAIPSVLEILLLQTKGIDCQSTLAKLRYILSSGEILALHIAEKLTTVLPEVTLLNLYGSTEVSGDVTCMELKAPLTSAQMAEWQERGIPIANLNRSGIVGGAGTSLLLASNGHQNHSSEQNGSALPTMVWPLPGETTNEASGVLYVSGSLVSLGYVGDNGAGSFINFDVLLDNSKGRKTDKVAASRRWFCTGDFCSVNQGRLYFCGRKDNAVKINGERVYLETVERAVATALKEVSKGTRFDAANKAPDFSSKQVIAFTTTREITKYAILQQRVVACIICDDVANSVSPYPRARALDTWVAEHYGASHAPHQVFVVSTHAVQRRAHGKIDRRALETLLSHGTGDSKILLRSSATDGNASSTSERLLTRLLKEILDIPLTSGRIPENLRSQTFSEIGANSLLSTLFVYELDQVFGSHRVKSQELLGMTIREVLSTLDSWKEDRLREVPVISVSPPSTHHGTRIRDKAFEGLDSESEIGSEVKRPKLLHVGATTDSAGSAGDTKLSMLTHLSRYNQSSMGVNGIYLPTCPTTPLSSSGHASMSSLSSSWMLTTGWRVDLEKCIDASPLVIQRNASRGSVTSTWAIVGSHSAQLICVDVQNGNEIWRVTLDDRIEACAALSVMHEIVYVGTYTGSMFALELQSGKTRWSFHAKETIKSSAVVIDAHQLVIFGAYDNNLYGLDTVTGQERWAIDLQGSVFSTPLYCGWSEQLFTATTHGSVVAFQVTSSSGEVKEQWKLQLPAPVFAGLNADYAAKLVIVGCADGNLYGISMESGDRQWQLPTEKPIFSSPCVYRAGSVVFGSHDGKLRKVNSRNGKLVWSTNLHGAVFASPSVVRLLAASPTQCADNERRSNGDLVCCVTTTNGDLYFCDENTGAIIYQTCDSSGKATGSCEDLCGLGPLFGSPVLIDNWCLLGTRTNYFYGFELKQARPGGS